MKSDLFYDPKITLITGGVGGAKLVRGFAKAFYGRSLSIITNTADDAIFHGLYVSPDLDTMLYTLAGLSDPQKGWGIQDDSFHVLSQLSNYGEDTWFNLGDRDLATHILRTKLLKEGLSLTEVTITLSKRLGIQAAILPMTDQKVASFVKSEDALIPFQEYFVKFQQKIEVKDVSFRGIRKAHCTSDVRKAIKNADLIVIAPSNPIVSVLPVLSVNPIKRLVTDSKAMKIAVSPFLSKKAISGPAKVLMESKGYEGSSHGLALFYKGLINALVIHHADHDEKQSIEKTGISAVLTDTLMRNANDSVRLAKEVFRIFTEARS